MSGGLLVTFSGVDSAGKTTQLERLRQALQARGRPVEAMWYRPGYSKLLDAARARIRKRAPSALPAAGPSKARTAVFERPGVTEAWLAVAHADMFAQYAITVRRRLRAGTIVLCDRYLDDAQMDLQFRFPSRARWSARGISLLRTMCPRPDHAFLLMLSWDEMLRRQKVKNEPFPDSEDVRQRRFQAYQQLASSGRYQVILAERSVDEIHDELVARVDRGMT